MSGAVRDVAVAHSSGPPQVNEPTTDSRVTGFRLINSTGRRHAVEHTAQGHGSLSGYSGHDGVVQVGQLVRGPSFTAYRASFVQLAIGAINGRATAPNRGNPRLTAGLAQACPCVGHRCDLTGNRGYDEVSGRACLRGER